MCMAKRNKIASVIMCAVLLMSGCGAGGVRDGGSVDTGNSAGNHEDTGGTESSAQENENTDSAGSSAQENENTDSAGSSAENEQNTAQPDETDLIPLQVIDDNYRTYYEVFVYSFCDSDGDGIGDLQGLISKLDYINDGDDATDTDLGCNGIWLMPVNPSPTYHKYDVADYYAIDEQYGTMEDFEELIAECDKRGIKVIMDLVLNHSSSENPWFQEAYAYVQGLGDGEPDAAQCPYFDYYHFSKEPGGGYYEVEGTDWYYEAQFWSEMPDLNLDCEALREEISQITQYWLDLGVGGFRLDAVKEYYSGAPQSNIEFLAWLTDTVREQKEDAYLVGEAWLPMTEYAQYYDSGIDSIFDFAFADKDGIISKVLNGSPASKYGESVASLREVFGSHNENYIDAPFYTNHDMGRSAGYYAGDGSENKTKLAAAMNLFMGGSAFVYYGEELGMKGSGKDENKRAPMYWCMDENAKGMCDGPADMDDVTMKFGSLEEQQTDAASVYAFYKKAIRVRNQNPEIARGETEFLQDVSTDTVCVLRKDYEGSELLIVFVTGDKTENVDLSDIILNGDGVGTGCEIRAALTTGEEKIGLEDGIFKMPGYSVLVIK
mgnify:CR=1 FL=1